MRILKYLFLILLLALFAAAVYIATQRGDYDIRKSTVIALPKKVVFGYLNELNNWELWYADKNAERTYSKVTTGKGAAMDWETAMSDGSVIILSTKGTDSIVQRITADGLPSESYWILKDTAGGTKVTWHVKGKLGFMPKVHATLQGGPSKVIGEEYNDNLARLKKSITSEISKYQIRVHGLVHKPGTNYLAKTITSKIENLPKNISIMTSQMLHFFDKNKMRPSGKPFVLYDYFDYKKGLTKFSVCIPVREEIFVAPESDISAGKTETYLAVKTTLTGDHSHLPEAWDKTFAYCNANKYEESDEDGYIEVYSVTMRENKRPSQWKTEIYVPVKDKSAPVEPPKPAPRPVRQDPERPAVTPDAEIAIP